MNPTTCDEYDDIYSLISTSRVYTCMKAAHVQPEQPHPPAHEALTRRLYRLDVTPTQLWAEAQPLALPHRGMLVILTAGARNQSAFALF